MELVTSLQKLVNTAGHFTIELKNPPCYIKKLSEEIGQIVLIQKKVTTPYHRVQKTSSFVRDSDTFTSLYDLELSGNPLESPFHDETEFDTVIQDQKIEECYYPVTLQEARRILSLSNMNNSSINDSVPIWVMTDSKDKDKTLMLANNFQPVNNRKWYISSMVTNLGLLSLNSNELDLNVLKNKHEEMLKMSGVSLKVNIKCLYKIFGSGRDPEYQDDFADVSLYLTWNKLTFDIPHTATTELCVEVKVGSTHTADGLYSEIQILDEYLTCLKEYDQTKHVTPVIKLPKRDSQKSLTTMTDKIRQLFEETDYVSQLKKMTTISSSSQNELLALSKAVNEAERNSYCQDFIDMLWTVVKDSEDYNSMTSCYNWLFDEITHRDMKPFVHSNNNTRLSQMVKKLLTDDDSQYIKLHTYDSGALEMTIEIGVNKLIRDFLIIFTNCELATKELLAPPTFRNKKIDRKDVIESLEAKLCWLKKMQTVVELLLVIQSNMDLSNSVLHQLTSEAIMKLVHSDKETDTHLVTFRSHIKTHLIDKYIKGSFDSCRLSMSSSKSNRKMESVYFLSILPVLPPTALRDTSSISDLDDTIEVDDAEDVTASSHIKYYTTCMRTLSNLL